MKPQTKLCVVDTVCVHGKGNASLGQSYTRWEILLLNFWRVEVIARCHTSVYFFWKLYCDFGRLRSDPGLWHPFLLPTGGCL